MPATEMISNTETEKPARSLPKRICDFYVDGFRSMTVGRKLWALIIIKLIVIFLVLKLFFFPDFLASKSDSDSGKAQVVRESLTRPQISDMQ